MGASFHPLSERFDDALRLASRRRRLHAIAGTVVPAVAHPLAACATVLQHGGSEDEAIAVLLIGLPTEGRPMSARRIARRFGDRVAYLVQELSCGKASGRGRRRDTWGRSRKDRDRLLARLRATGDDAVLTVAGADELVATRVLLEDHRLLGDAVFRRCPSGRRDPIWYAHELATVLVERDPTRPLFRELYRTVAELERRGPHPG